MRAWLPRGLLEVLSSAGGIRCHSRVGRMAGRMIRSLGPRGKSAEVRWQLEQGQPRGWGRVEDIMECRKRMDRPGFLKEFCASQAQGSAQEGR
ncbi:hypothetical protein C8R44DRAFT_796503 [Mycena epipterygia]|nr:hypothetical protein C8R44DRAFT_796503 [Mycena epipterygia]